jgi:hypothetical protein
MWDGCLFTHHSLIKYITLPSLTPAVVRLFSQYRLFRISGTKLFTGGLIGRDVAFLDILQAHQLYRLL